MKEESCAVVSNEIVLPGKNVVEYDLQELIQELDFTIDETAEYGMLVNFEIEFVVQPKEERENNETLNDFLNSNLDRIIAESSLFSSCYSMNFDVGHLDNHDFDEDEE